MRDTLIKLILEQRQRGATVFMSSHIFKELEDTCDRVAFIHNGKMIDTVDKSMYSETMPKQYRIGFADENEYQNFIDEKSFEIVKKNDKSIAMCIFQLPTMRLQNFWHAEKLRYKI